MNNYLIISFLIYLLFIIVPSNICLDMIALNNLLLNEHNKYRKSHGVPNLQLDNDLIKFAVAYAESLAKNKDENYLEPSGIYYQGDEKLGENLFQCNKKTCKMENLTQPLDIWYKEKEFYNYNTNLGEKGTANFTQMVWKSTKKLGCGAAQRNENSYKVVCFYLPKGNVGEKYDVNVLPLVKTEDQNSITNDTTNQNPYMDYGQYITNNSFNLKYSFLFHLSYILFLLFVYYNE